MAIGSLKGRRIVIGAVSAALLCGLVGLLAAGPFDQDMTLVAAMAALLVLALVLGRSLLVAGAAARRRKAPPVVSAELRLVAARLLGLEKRVTLLTAERAPEPDAEAVADLGLLGELVRSLADALGQQEREISDLRTRVERLTRQVEPGLSHSPERPSGARSSVESWTARATSAPTPARSALEPLPAPSYVPSLIPALRDEAARIDGVGETEPPSGDERRAAIAEALAGGRLELHLQPIVQLPQRRLRGYEALARLRLSQDTLLMPAEFMPALERLGLSGRLDEKVVARALVLVPQLAGRDGGEPIVACNLSPASLKDSRFVAALERLALENPIAARRLVLELPQRAWRDLPAAMLVPFDRLRAVGVAFAMDRVTDLSFEDVACGPDGVGLVKIPGSLLARSLDEGRAEAVLARLVEHGVRIVAEQVENERDIPDLIDLDVPLAQGHAFGRPRHLQAELASEDRPALALGRIGGTASADDDTGPAARPLRSFLRRVV